MTSNSDAIKDLLLEDYRHRAEAMTNSEQLGETRLNIFVGLAAFLLSALVSLSTQEYGPKGDALKFIVLAVLLFLCVLGGITLLRLISRNKRTDECKRDLDHIRQTFKDLFDEDGQLVSYYPIGDLRPKRQGCGERQPKQSSRGFGGLAHSMSIINSFLVASSVACLFWPLQQSFSLISPETLPVLIWAAVALAIAFICQLWYIHRREKQAKQECNETLTYTKLTHAGGVVYRTNNNEIEYLIIRPKRAGTEEWVLPKGHIEDNENYVETALREVKEETAAMTRPVCPLDVVEFNTHDEHIRAKFYLLEYLFDLPVPTENRCIKWLPFEQALAELTHSESQHLLTLAERKRRKHLQK